MSDARLIHAFVVSDDPIARERFVATLARHQAKVEACNPLEALNRLVLEKPDAVIVDARDAGLLGAFRKQMMRSGWLGQTPVTYTGPPGAPDCINRDDARAVENAIEDLLGRARARKSDAVPAGELRLCLPARHLPLREGEYVIGRASTCDIVLEDPTVSRRHARVRVRGEHLVVEDLESRHGVLVNGIRIASTATVQEGDRVQIGGQIGLVARLSPEAPLEGPPRRVEDTARLRRVPVTHTADLPLGELEAENLARAVQHALANDDSRWAATLLRPARTMTELRASRGLSTPLDARVWVPLAGAAVRVARKTGDVEWLAWALALHTRGKAPPRDEIVAEITGDWEEPTGAQSVVRSYLSSPALSDLSTDDAVWVRALREWADAEL